MNGIIANVKRWRAANIPIDGIGSQTHIKSGEGKAAADAFRHICKQVPYCAITELDVAGAAPADYAAVARACYDTSNCVGITVWGVLDGQSWRRGQNGLLFGDDGREKAAFTAIANALTAY